MSSCWTHFCGCVFRNQGTGTVFQNWFLKKSQSKSILLILPVTGSGRINITYSSEEKGNFNIFFLAFLKIQVAFAGLCLEMLLYNTKSLLQHKLYSHKLTRYYMK